MKVATSRHLNEKNGLLGLTAADFAFVSYILVISHSVLLRYGLEVASIPISLTVATFLVSVRLRFRRKTIRDYLSSKRNAWRVQ